MLISISASIKNNAHSAALFTVTFSHLQYNIFERESEAISGKKCKIARNSLTSTFKDIVMQMKKVTVKGAVAMARIQQLFSKPNITRLKTFKFPILMSLSMKSVGTMQMSIYR